MYKTKIKSIKRIGYKDCYDVSTPKHHNFFLDNGILSHNCALTGGTGQGKSYCGLKICELYSEMYNIPFDPKIHVIASLKELLQLITAKDVDKKIQFGSIIMFDEPQVEANARNFQSDMNQAFSQLISTFRNQRLVVLFATPRLNMLDKQSRVLFHGEFKVRGFDKNTKITHVEPRFLEYAEKEYFLHKRLIIQQAVAGKKKMNITKLQDWHLPIASTQTINIYEYKKKAFSDELNIRLLNNIELQEKQAEGKNKSEEFDKVRELFDRLGENYEEILKEMPHLSPFAIEKYVYFIKKSRKMVNSRRVVVRN